MKKMLLLIWTLVIIYTLQTIVNNRMESNDNRKTYEKLKYTYTDERYQETHQFISEESINSQPFSLHEINGDYIGWIKLPNTRVDYPVVRGEDNEFYLSHNFYKEPSKAGAIFMDFRNNQEVKDKHTILYGHNMKDGSMFRDLIKYKNEEFFKNHPIIELNTPNKNMKWQVFSIYITGVDFYYIETDFSSLEEFERFSKEIKDKSLFPVDIQVSEKDEILTLSTCSYEFNNARLVLHAKRI